MAISHQKLFNSIARNVNLSEIQDFLDKETTQTWSSSFYQILCRNVVTLGSCFFNETGQYFLLRCPFAQNIEFLSIVLQRALFYNEASFLEKFIMREWICEKWHAIYFRRLEVDSSLFPPRILNDADLILLRELNSFYLKDLFSIIAERAQKEHLQLLLERLVSISASSTLDTQILPSNAFELLSSDSSSSLVAIEVLLSFISEKAVQFYPFEKALYNQPWKVVPLLLQHYKKYQLKLPSILPSESTFELADFPLCKKTVQAFNLLIEAGIDCRITPIPEFQEYIPFMHPQLVVQMHNDPAIAASIYKVNWARWKELKEEKIPLLYRNDWQDFAKLQNDV